MKLFWRKKYAKKGSFKDSDADGLTDAEEKKLGTNPDKKDSDSDGLNDYEEVKVYMTDPNNSDTDGDGMSDGKEVKRGRNPLGPGKLKDFFIPHEGNNYRPNSLHPGRLAFYTISSIAIKSVVVVSLIAMPVTAWLTPDVLKEESKKIIFFTNEIRKNLGLNLLVENFLLSESALEKVQDMLVQQYFAHVSPEKKGLTYWLSSIGYKYKFAGENLAMGFSGAEDVVNAWTKSKTHYANIIDPDFSEIGVAMASGLYNNRDTTLAAQYFGSPAEEKKAEINKKSIPNLPTPAVVEVKKNKEEKKQIAEESVEEENVLAEKEEIKEPLESPRVISPSSESVFKNSDVKITLFVPEAEKVAAYDRGEKIIELKKEPDNYYVDIEFSFSEGVHNLRFESQRGKEISSFNNYSLIIDSTPPIVDVEKTKIFIDEPEGKEEKIIGVIAYLSDDTAKAQINIGNYNINLSRDESEDDKWVGQLIIFNEKDKEEIFDPVVLANISAQDVAGNLTVEDVNWEKIIPSKANLINQYFFIKGHQSKESSFLLKISSVFYKILFSFIFLALLINVFINIKKQRAGVIVSALGLMGFLFLLIIL